MARLCPSDTKTSWDTRVGAWAMTEKKAGRDYVTERLHDAIEGLQHDVTRVEIWATALSTFTQPVPDYRTDPKFELGQPVETGPLAEKPDLERVENAARKPPK